MKITTAQLKQIIREEIRKVSLKEAKEDLLKRVQNLNDRIKKLQKKLGDTKSPTQKQEIQGKLSRALQSLSNLKKQMGVKKEGYERISKNMGYTKDQTIPSEYKEDGSGILATKEDEKLAEAEEKWIQKAVKKPGQLHKDLGVPQGEKIPQAKLKSAAEKSGKVGQRARLALTLKGLK